MTLPNTLLLIGGLIIFLIGGLFAISVLEPDAELKSDTPEIVVPGEDLPTSDLQSFTFPVAGFSFMYPNYYELTQAPSTEVESIQLMEKDASAEFRNPEFDGEMPPTITISAYSHGGESLLDWARAHSEESEIDRAFADPVESELHGKDALRYVADGLYAQDTLITKHNEYIIVFTSSFIDENSLTKKDFEPLLQSVKFRATE